MAPLTHATESPDDNALAWLFTLDARRLARLQLATFALALVLAAALGVVLHAAQLGLARELLIGGSLTRTSTLHGAAATLLFLPQSIAATVGTLALLRQLRSRNLAFPRLNLGAFHLWLGGGVLLAVYAGASLGGWTLLASRGPSDDNTAPMLLLALASLAVSGLLRAVVTLTTLHQLRAEGQRWSATNPLAWALYAHALVTVLTTPVLLLSLALVGAERILDLGLFEAANGGDPLLLQHLQWMGFHGLAYSAVLPALGVLSELFGAQALNGLRAPRSVLAATVGLALVSVLAWGVHLPVGAHSLLAATWFALMALLALVPFTQLCAAWLLTLARPRDGAARGPAVLLALAAAACFAVGALSGAFLAVMNVGAHLHGTAFVTGHSHVWFAGIVLALLAGVHDQPEELGLARPAPSPARWGALLAVVGALLAFVPQLLLGAQGFPRRAAPYPAAVLGLTVTSALGAVLLVAALALLLGNVLQSQLARRDENGGA